MKLFYGFLSRLPLSLLYGLSTLLAFALYRIARYRRSVVAENLANAFPEASAAERQAIERKFYAHLGDLAFEMIAARNMPRSEFNQRITLENPEILQPFKERQQPLLLLTNHQGNWEWLQHPISDYLNYPIDAVYKTLHNKAFDAFIYEIRSRSGKPIPFQEAAREILRRRREARGFAMLADQAPFKRDKRYWHLFFGQPGSFYLGPQKIAEVTQYPVVFIAMTKQRRGYYSARFEILAEPPHARGGFDILDRYIAALERAIRAQPETWMWSNRKWKHKPPADWQQHPVSE